MSAAVIPATRSITDMNNYYLAVDIGASSGRHILCHLDNGTMVLEEVYRFDNGIQDMDGSKCWDCDHLFSHIKAGMRRCAELGKVPVSMGVDTWGVDFVLLKEGKRIGNAVSYRDSRTQGMDAEVSKRIDEKALYARTGIQKQMYNTIYQLMALKCQNPELLQQADTLLMTPDYYHWCLTGIPGAEYTISSTSQLVDPHTRDWDWALIEQLGYPKRIFQTIRKPGTVLGELLPEIQEEVGFNCQVILPGCHDTASAVLAVPSNEQTVYISSGTWSLMGVELEEAICTEESRMANFANEGGWNFSYRFLKNIMGLWMIQSVRNELGRTHSFAELCAMAEEVKDFPSRLDVNDDAFFAPDSMIEAIQDYCRATAQQVPQTPGQLATVIYQSLAECYGETIRHIETITGKTYDAVSVVGGGSNADYLNQLTANATGKTVYAGPGEATAIGNVTAQMLAAGVFQSVSQARKCIFDSFNVSTFLPI